VGCFSFHPRKIITTGEGGMITTDDDLLAERIAVLRSHGAVRGELYMSFEDAGFNYRLSDINAAIGIAQMARLEGIIGARRAHAARYAQLLGDLAGVGAPPETDGVRHTYQSYVVTLDPAIDRDEVIRRMMAEGIETTLGTYALHAQPHFQRTYGYHEGDLVNSAQAYRRSLTLPLYPQLTASDLERVVSTLADVLDRM
jgi:dTDP-4-amino-4,6-dideoxygalactose transaminase